MKPKNFPARKLKRQLKAQGKNPTDHKQEIAEARAIRTKKNRA